MSAHRVALVVLVAAQGVVGCGPEIEGEPDTAVSEQALSVPVPIGALLEATGNVNLRSGPGTNYSILKVVPIGTRPVTVNRETPQNGFYNIKYSGTTGWSSGTYLKLVDPCPAIPSGAFTGCYYDDSGFTAARVARTENQIDFDWANGSPHSLIAADTFSVRWRGTHAFEAATYDFAGYADDTVKLFIDNVLVLDTSASFSISRVMTAGQHAIRVDYQENGGNAVARLSWTKHSASAQVSISCDPPTPALPQNSSGTINCTVTSSGVSGSVAISAGTLPAGVSLSPLATSVPGNTTTNVAIGVSVQASVPQATHSFQVVASSGATRATHQSSLAVSANTHRLNVLYLVPSDKTPWATQGIERLVRHLQIWYRNQLGNGKTFTLSLPVVRVLPTPHAASWYPTHPNPPNQADHWLWYYNNVIAEANALAGAGFYQTNDTYLVYTDADPESDQIAGGTSGMALLHGRDIRALMNQDPEWTLCREYGGSGHELGHGFYLPHPPTPWTSELMGTGYAVYPNAFLTSSDKATLNGSGFFSTNVNITTRLFSCASLTSY